MNKTTLKGERLLEKGRFSEGERLIESLRSAFVVILESQVNVVFPEFFIKSSKKEKNLFDRKLFGNKQ